MAQSSLPSLVIGGERDETGAARNADRRSFGGVLLRRVIAHIIDSIIVYAVTAVVVVVLALMNLVTLGLFGAPIVGLGVVVPILYFTAFTGGVRSATPGMRFMKIELVTMTGGSPGYKQAGLRTMLFYASIVVLSPLILVVALFNERHRALHDILTSTSVVNHLVVARSL